MCKHSVPNKSELKRLPFWNRVLRFPAQVHQIILAFLLVFFTHLNKLLSFMPNSRDSIYLQSGKQSQELRPSTDDIYISQRLLCPNELICTLWFQAAEVALSLDSVCCIILFQNIKGGKQNHQ